MHGQRHGSSVHAAGIVTQRQRPQTASGTIFVTLEDEHGPVNVIVWPRVAQRRRKALLNSTLLAVRGRRSEERRVGKESVSTWRSPGSPYHEKNNKKNQSKKT